MCPSPLSVHFCMMTPFGAPCPADHHCAQRHLPVPPCAKRGVQCGAGHHRLLVQHVPARGHVPASSRGQQRRQQGTGTSTSPSSMGRGTAAARASSSRWARDAWPGLRESGGYREAGGQCPANRVVNPRAPNNVAYCTARMMCGYSYVMPGQARRTYAHGYRVCCVSASANRFCTSLADCVPPPCTPTPGHVRLE